MTTRRFVAVEVSRAECAGTTAGCSVTIEQRNVGSVSEPPIARVSRHLLQHTDLFELRYSRVGRRVRRSDQQLDVRDRDDRPIEQRLQYLMAVARGTTEPLRNRRAVLLAHQQNSARRLRAFCSHLDNSAQEEPQPRLPFTAVANGLKVVVVLLPVLFEVV